MDLKKLGIALVALCPVAAFAQGNATDPEVEFETLLRDIRGLEAYNALLQRQISAQETDIQNLQQAVTRVPELERQLPPMLINMVDGLDEFVDLDLPFLQQERADRIATLQLLVENSGVSDAQKLRRILEAWTIEVEYGSTFQTETGQVPIDGSDRPVDFVIMGRLGLLFQTSDDDAITGAWDHANQQWVLLGSEYRNPVRQAIRMGRNQVAPDLLLLPVSAPEN